MRNALLILAALRLVPLASVHAADGPLAFDDPRPQRYEFVARARQRDPRARPHPELEFVFEKGGQPADTEHAAVGTRVPPQGKLVIWLWGTMRRCSNA
jgi:hypothetical protein